MPERYNTIGTGGVSSGNAPDALLAALPESSRELGHLQILGGDVGHLDRVTWPEILARGDSGFSIDAPYATGGGGGTGTTSGTATSAIGETGWTPVSTPVGGSCAGGGMPYTLSDGRVVCLLNSNDQASVEQ